MDQIGYQREILAFNEKIALAKLEESKANERVKELEYQKERFNLDYFIEIQKRQEIALKKQKDEIEQNKTQSVT